MTKLKAASYHFVISVIVFSIIFSVFILLWFPQPYFIVTGGWQGLIIAAAVDIVLGPLLTFIVFNAAKPTKNLKFDLSIIVLIQFSALILGIHTIYQQRPVANVFWKGTFSTVNAVSLTEQGVDLKLLSALSEAKPAFIYLKAHKGQKYYLSGEQKGQKIPRFYRADLYQPLEENFDKMLNYKLDIDTMLTLYPSIGSELVKVLESKALEKDDLYYFKAFSSHRNMIVIFDKKGNYISQILLSTEIPLVEH